MKRFFTLYLLLSLVNLVQAQCPIVLDEDSGDGSTILLTLGSSAECANYPAPGSGILVAVTSSAGTGNYGVGYCNEIFGVTYLQLQYDNGTPILQADAPISILVSGSTCPYNNMGECELTKYNLTGTASPWTVGLSGSATGVTYYLQRNGVDVPGASVAGTGSALSFSAFPQTAGGAYTIQARNAGGCPTAMNNSVSISQCPTQLNEDSGDGSIILLTLGSSAECDNYPAPGSATLVAVTSSMGTGNYGVGFCNTNFGVTILQLQYDNGIPILQADVPVSITVGGVTCPYNSAGVCELTLFNLTGTTSPWTVGLSGSETGITYYLQRNGVDVPGASVVGTGSALSFSAFSQTTAGTYTIQARNTGGCPTTMTGDRTIATSGGPLDPTGYIYCQETGQIITGGTVSVSGPGAVTIAQNGNTGRYQFFTDGTPGTYTITYTPPTGYSLSTTHLPAGTLIPTGQPNPYALGAGSANGTFLNDFTPAANTYYFSFSFVPGDPDVVLNNIPLTGCCLPPSLTIAGTSTTAICANGSIDLATLVSSAGGGTLSYHATQADAQNDLAALPSSTVSPTSAKNYYIRSEINTPGGQTCHTVREVTVNISAPTCGTISVSGPN